MELMLCRVYLSCEAMVIRFAVWSIGLLRTAWVRWLLHPVKATVEDHETTAGPRPMVLRIRLAAVVTALIGTILITSMIRTGLDKGMDHVVPEAVDNAANAIAIAISDMAYGLNKGYVGYAAVLDALQAGGITKHPLHLKNLPKPFEENIRDREQLNQAIQKALSVQVPSQQSFTHRTMFSMVAEALGLVDYYKLSFALFGFNVESTFYTYFVIFSLSAILFLLGHRHRPLNLSALIVLLSAFYFIISAEYFTQINLATVANTRFLSTLGIIPGLHLLLLVLNTRRIRFENFVYAAGQTGILIFSYAAREAILWLILFLCVLAILKFLTILANGRGSTRKLAGRALLTSTWPVMLLLGGLLAQQWHISATMHPTYKTDDFLSHHLHYHNAFLGLQSHPDWQKRFGSVYANADGSPASGDTVGWIGSVRYLSKHYNVDENYLISNLSGTYKARLHDQVMQQAYFEFIRENPIFVIEVHFYKFIGVFGDWIRIIRDNPENVLWTLLFVAIAVGFSLLQVLTDKSPAQRLHDAIQLALLTLGLTMFSLMPAIYAYPSLFVSSDQFWVITFAAGMVLWMLATRMLAFIVKPYWGGWRWTLPAITIGPRHAQLIRSAGIALCATIIVVGWGSLNHRWLLPISIANVDTKPPAVKRTNDDIIQPSAPASRGNLFWPSEALDKVQWRFNSASLIKLDASGPLGADSSWKLIEGNVPDLHRMEATISVNSVMNQAVLSAYLRPAGRTHAYIELRNAPATVYSLGQFNLEQGTATAKPPGLAGIERLKDGWVRCWISIPLDADTAVFTIGAMDDDYRYAGDGQSGIGVWGIQFEPGFDPSIYIRTDSGPVFPQPKR